MKRFLLSALFLLGSWLFSHPSIATADTKTISDPNPENQGVTITIDPYPITTETQTVRFVYQSTEPFFFPNEDYEYRIQRPVGTPRILSQGTVRPSSDKTLTISWDLRDLSGNRVQAETAGSNFFLSLWRGQAPTFEAAGQPTALSEFNFPVFAPNAKEPSFCANTPIAKGETITIVLRDAAAGTPYSFWVHGSRGWVAIRDGSGTYNIEAPQSPDADLTYVCMTPGNRQVECGGNNPEAYRVSVKFEDHQVTTTTQECSDQTFLAAPGTVSIEEIAHPVTLRGPQQCPSNGGTGIQTALGCVPISDSNTLVAWFLRWAVGIAGGVAFLFILLAGFQIMTASGNPERLQHGRELLTAAISGLILIIFSVFLLNLIGVEILNLPGLKK